MCERALEQSRGVTRAMLPLQSLHHPLEPILCLPAEHLDSPHFSSAPILPCLLNHSCPFRIHLPTAGSHCFSSSSDGLATAVATPSPPSLSFLLDLVADFSV